MRNVQVDGKVKKYNTLVAYDYANIDYVKKAQTTSLDGGLDTVNKITASIGSLRYYLYLKSGNLAVLCYDDNNKEVFNFDTGVSTTNNHDYSLMVNPDGRLAIYCSYYTASHSILSDGIRIYILDDNLNPSSVTTVSETMNSWFSGTGGSYHVNNIAFAQGEGFIHIAILIRATSTNHAGFLYTKYDGALKDRYYEFAFPSTAIAGDFKFGDAKMGRGFVPLYLNTPSFTNAIDGQSYSEYRFMVGNHYDVGSAESIFSGFRKWDGDFDAYINWESVSDLDGGGTISVDNDLFAAFAGDTDHVVASSYYNDDNQLIETLTKNDVYVVDGSGIVEYDVAEAISSDKKTAFGHYYRGLITLDLFDYTDGSDVALECRIYALDELSSSERVVTLQTGHNASTSVKTPLLRYDYDLGYASGVRYASSSGQLLLTDIDGKQGDYLISTDRIVEEVEGELSSGGWGFGEMEGGDSSGESDYAQMADSFSPFIFYDYTETGDSSSTGQDIFLGGDSTT